MRRLVSLVPIIIYSAKADRTTVAWLCDENWRLPDQTAELERWVRENGSILPPGEYVADIGFAPRGDAFGGGGAFSPETMRIMADLGITLFLTEYPELDQEPEG